MDFIGLLSDIKFNNGVCLQWGQSDGGQIVSVTLPISYTLTNYSVLLTDVAKSANGVEFLSVGVGNSYNQTINKFTAIGNTSNRSSSFKFFTIGY